MKPTPATLALRVLGALSLAVAAVRLAIRLYQSFQISEPAPTDAGFMVGISVDHLTLGLVAVGIVLCVLGFRGRRTACSGPQPQRLRSHGE